VGLTLPAYLKGHAEGCVLSIRLQPRARRTAVVGPVGSRLKVAVTGPPVEGKANTELCRFLAELTGVSKSAVIILRGETSREKAILIRGVAAGALLARLGG